MKITLLHKQFTIEVFDDTADNNSIYDKMYRPDNDTNYEPVSKHAIVVYQDGVQIASAILLTAAGATTVTEDSIIIDYDHLITRCGNTVFCLTIPDLNLQWMTEADWATCFSIHKYQDSYITHGETSITRIDNKGNLLWSYSGADIFVCLDGRSSFEMHDTYIVLTDFNGGRYEIDYNGETISKKP